jgi:D-lactate dehydrogenase
MKLTAYGVRQNEIKYFNDLNKYGYELNLIADNLSHDNIETAKGSDAVLLRANNVGDKQNLDQLNEWGIKYVFTRTVGYNHIDLEAAKANGQHVAYVPGYSPKAVAELAFTLAQEIQRGTALAIARAAKGDFKVYPDEFATELHEFTVGIIGTGRIGVAEAQLWNGTGAKVLGYDVFQSDYAKEHLEFVSQEELVAQADIVSLHVPHFPGQNDNFFNADLISKMKDGAILVNTARAEITDEQAIVDAVKAGKLRGFATDVITREKDVFGKDFVGESTGHDVLDQMIDLYPRVILTPHLGSYTEQALIDMIAISYDNLNDVITTGESKNLL